MTLSLTLLRRLNSALVDRNVNDGFRMLERAAKALDSLTPQEPYAVPFLLSLAQWVDLGFRDHRLLEELLERFTSVRRSEMKLSDFLQLRMVESFVAFATEDATTAIAILEHVLVLQPEILEPRLILMAHYWKGRAHRQKGEYELAMLHIVEAKRIAQEMAAPKLIAVIKIHESWLQFQRGRRKDAVRLLDEAEVELAPTGHALSLGNIESAREDLFADLANMPRLSSTFSVRSHSTPAVFPIIPTWRAHSSTPPMSNVSSPST